MKTIFDFKCGRLDSRFFPKKGMDTARLTKTKTIWWGRLDLNLRAPAKNNRRSTTELLSLMPRRVELQSNLICESRAAFLLKAGRNRCDSPSITLS